MQPSSSRHRLWFSVAIAALPVVAVAAFFAGGEVEHSARARDAVAAKQQYGAVETQFLSLQAANALLSADVWSYRAVTALDDRNFGLANDAAAKASASLNGVDAEAAGVSVAALKAAQNEAAGVKVYVATDLGAQRSQLLRLAADIAALALPKPSKAS